MFKKILTGLFLLVLLFQSCGLSNRDIENNYWKLSDIRRGDTTKMLMHQVDHISFGESRYYFLQKDTIYRDNLPYGVIIDRNKGLSTSIEIIIIGSLDTLRYVAK